MKTKPQTFKAADTEVNAYIAAQGIAQATGKTLKEQSEILGFSCVYDWVKSIKEDLTTTAAPTTTAAEKKTPAIKYQSKSFQDFGSPAHKRSRKVFRKPQQTRTMKVYYLEDKPKIMISGDYLSDAGFEIGDTINLDFSIKGTIIITKKGGEAA